MGVADIKENKTTSSAFSVGFDFNGDDGQCLMFDSFLTETTVTATNKSGGCYVCLLEATKMTFSTLSKTHYVL